MRKLIPDNRKYRWLIWAFPVVGLLSLIWFLIRVVPKPSRATYPCQRVAMPFASGFVVWAIGLIASTLAYRKARRLVHQSRYGVAVVCLVAAVAAVWLSVSVTGGNATKAANPHPANSPIGVAKGLHPGRVVWVHEPDATDWKGPGTGDGHWWQSNHTNQEVVNAMMLQAICGLASVPDVSEAWDLLFRHFNQERGKGDVGYQPGEKITIKVNFVQMIAVGGNTNYHFANRRPDYPICSPQIMYALLDHLVNIVGVAESDITIGDPTCLWCHEFYDMIRPDFPQVRYLDYLGNYNRTKMKRSTVPFYWSTAKSGGKRQDYVLQSYVDAEYFINLASLKGHYDQAGITLCAKNHYGSLRGPTASGYYNMHSDCPFNVPQSGRYRNMVDLMGHDQVGGKTFLCLIDGLYAGKHALSYPNNLPRKWQMEPFNNDWPSSLFVSQDQVAIDSVGFDFLISEWPEASGPAHAGTDDYLHEAALADNPPSGTFYDPEGGGTRLASLGVHEHWNNPTDKQYSRNLETGNGIELRQVSLAPDVDFSGDGKVDLEDFSILSQYWFQDELSVDIAPSPFGDSIVNFEDIAALAEFWLTSPGIVAHWQLDETEGYMAHDSAGGRDAFVVGPVWQPTGGKVVGALKFDGTDDYVSTPFVLDPADGAFSVFAWIKGGAPGQVIIGQANGANWLAADSSEGWLITELRGTGRFGGSLWSQTVITDDNWHRVGLTWDGSIRILYVDDVEVAKDTQAGLTGSTGGLYFGARKDAGRIGFFFSGLIDDVRLYNWAVIP